MKLDLSRLSLCLSTAALLALYGCGGGSSSEPISGGASTTPPSITPPIITPPSITLPGVISGIAATGAALGNANVVITDNSGTSPCEQTTITTTALGSYSCTLKAGRVAPFFIVVTDPTGNTPPMVSIQSTTPAAGSNLTVNVTPLTTAIVAQLRPDGDALAVVASNTVDAAALKAITTNVVAQLANILASIGAPAGYDPFTTSITAATAAGTGNTADLVLDVVRIVKTQANVLAISTVDNPIPVLLASATVPGEVALAVNSNVASLSKGTQVAAQVLASCFAVPTAQRVLGKDDTITVENGGPKVVQSATQCQNLAANADNGAGITFLHNGYSAGQFFYSLLTSDQMTGAQFSVPEIMLFLPADTKAAASTPASYDRAVLNIKYIDNAGNPGNSITVAARLPGTATPSRPSEWWLVGNQQAVDTNVRLNIRRVEQLNPAHTSTFFISTYQTGMQFNINFRGPGSTLGGQPMNIARVRGPGLPSAGLVYKRSTGAQSTMDVFNKAGILSGVGAGSQCGSGGAANCPNVWLARTKGLTGTNAATLEVNQLSAVWAQSGDGFVPSLIVKGAEYQIELFYGTNVGTADLIVTKTLLSDLVQATNGVNLPWNSLGNQSLAALNPSGSLAGEQVNSLVLDWVQNPSAQQIGNLESIINSKTGTYGLLKSVPRGALSAVLDNQTVPAFSTSSGSRTLLYSYRMLDGSNKNAVYQYNEYGY